MPDGHLLFEEDGQKILRRPHGNLIGVHDEDIFVHLKTQVCTFEIVPILRSHRFAERAATFFLCSSSGSLSEGSCTTHWMSWKTRAVTICT